MAPRRSVGLGAWLCIALAITPVVAGAASGAEVAPALETRARALGLWQHPYWRLLLHYEADALGGYTSQADDPGFFVSPQGKTDPEAELVATLRAFASDDAAQPEAQSKVCWFPLRFAWLAEQLDFASAGVHLRACPELNKWLAAMNPGKVFLVFSSAFLNAPASAYGHTLLLVEQRAAPGNKLLANIINFAAYPTTDNPFLYTVLGLLGGFPGRFAAMPYYVKVQEYSNFESRDLWEYELALAPQQVMRMLLHAWELDRTYFDYYFLTENCSYHLLSLIEIARPELRLREQFPLSAIPTETLRAVLSVPGLVVARTFRPSHTRTMGARYQGLGGDEAELAADLALGESFDAQALDPLPAERRAAVLEAAHDYFKYEHGFTPGRDDSRPAPLREREFALLSTLGKLGLTTSAPEVHVPAPPEAGHAASRVGLGMGMMQDGRSFGLLWARPSLHDSLDLQDGYVPNSEVQMPALTLRFEQSGRDDAEPVTLERLDFVRITSLMARDGWVNRPSWRVALGGGRLRDLPCRTWRCTGGDLWGGIGYALGSQVLGGEVFYGFLDVLLQGSPALSPWYRVGADAALGAALQLSSSWRVHAEARWRYELLGDVRLGREVLELDAGTSLAISNAALVRLAASRSRDQAEASLGFFAYF